MGSNEALSFSIKNSFQKIMELLFTALFTNMRILKFKRQTSSETKLYLNGFKRSRFVICDLWISIRFVCFCVSRFIACDRNYD